MITRILSWSQSSTSNESLGPPEPFVLGQPSDLSLPRRSCRTNSILPVAPRSSGFPKDPRWEFDAQPVRNSLCKSLISPFSPSLLWENNEHSLPQRKRIKTVSLESTTLSKPFKPEAHW